MSSFSSQNVLAKHNQRRERQEITSIGRSNESNIYWKKNFHKNPFYSRINTDYEADNEIDKSNIGNKTTNIYKQNPVCDGYYIVSELDDVSKSGKYQSPLGYDNINWFVDEVKKLENKMAFYF